ncbi:S8 family serine peptidase [Halanaerobacter jeridensis]|uniref:Subtilisin family serine protease n=1 Tax=Halanaerobacter jeridensis TaxID=706427 RepID=A0A939BMT3_9FIRM|nr:S8 family serine peptidase [Halanaerobacter jeridensis]MBM7557435.1 subtilisin family serine protease [Halanaerobacter jeridensis]
MKKVLMFLLGVILIVSLLGCSSTQDEELMSEDSQEQLAQYQEGQLIVGIKEKETGISTQNVENLISTQANHHQQSIETDGFKVIDSVYDFSDSDSMTTLSNETKAEMVKTMGFVYTVEYDQEKYESYTRAKTALQESLKKSGKEIKYIEPNFKYYAIGVKKFPKIPSQEQLSSSVIKATAINNRQTWNYGMIKAPETWDSITKGSSSVKIAVLDTGIDYDHESLRRLVDSNLGRSFVSYSFNDGNGHGTHVAGTIASQGRVSGVMQNATLIPVKVLGDQGGGSLSAIQKGILYAADIGADVINMSLGGGGYSRAMADACQTAVNRGTVVVAASGNEGRSSIAYPSRYNSVIAVGAVDSRGNKANFSNYGSGLEVVAPGVNIYSTYAGNRYNSLSGTSMATPHVAGVVGLMRAANPNASVGEIRSALHNTAQNAGSSTYYGEGIVNAYQAVNAVYNGNDDNDDVQPSPDPDPSPSRNLALNKAISASDSYSSYQPDNANDGNTNDTFWATRADYYSDWLMLNLGERKRVNKVRVKWSAQNYAINYGIYYYDNGWQLAAKVNRGDGNWDEIKFDRAINAQHFCLIAEENNSYYYTVYEFELY